MRLRKCMPIVLMLALMGFWALEGLPAWEVNSVEAQEPPLLPTYDREWQPFPDPRQSTDGVVFRTQIDTGLIANADDIDDILPPPWKVRRIDDATAYLGVTWLYRVFSQWSNIEDVDPLVTHETVSDVLFAVRAWLGPDNPDARRLFILADIRSSASAVELNNATVGGGAEVSREGNIKMSFESVSKIGKAEILKFKAEVKEPRSGLWLKVNAKLPEGLLPERVTSQFNDLSDYVFLDVSTSPPTEGRVFLFATQYDNYSYDSETPGFKIHIVRKNFLRLPGKRKVRILDFGPSLTFRRNLEGYIKFPE